jgi:hypothetical protein
MGPSGTPSGPLMPWRPRSHGAATASAGGARAAASPSNAITGRPRCSPHERPLALLLPHAEEARAGIEDIYVTYRKSGIGATWQRFFAFTGISMQGGRGGFVSDPNAFAAVLRRTLR